MARTSPTVQDDTLLYQHEGQDYSVVVGTPAWFTWLATASTFSFLSAHGSFIARRERASNQRGGWYWRAYRRWEGKLHRAYLGRAEDVTLDRLNTIAQALAVPSRPLLSTSSDQRTSSHFPPPVPRFFLTTKLYIPVARTNLVPRPRLIARLTKGICFPLTLLVAPAGWGKTTLLAAWHADQRDASHPLAWISLDEGDNDPVRFWTYTLTALNTLYPGVADTCLAGLSSPQPPSIELLLSSVLNVCATFNTDAVLVLDDYHVIASQSIHDALAFLLSHLPAHLHLVIASRIDPPLPLARLRARGQLNELRAADLRFTSLEAAAFITEVMGLQLAESEIEALEARTEGWIAGLQLAALSMRDREDLPSFIAAFSGSNRYVLDYLAEEVLVRQPEVIQHFLWHTSVLERLCGDLCDAVLESTGSQALLEQLERAGLFLVPLDDQRHWYRYHQLFAGALRSRLYQAQPALIPELHRRASRWHEQHGQIDSAVEHALAANDVEKAAYLIEAFGFSIALQGQVATVLNWLKRLPEALVRAHALLCLLHAVLLLFTNHMEETEPFLQEAEAALQADMSAEHQRILRGQIATVRANVLHYSGDIVKATALAREALNLLPKTERAARPAALLLAASAYLVSGDVTSNTERLVLEVTGPVRNSGNVFAAFSSYIILARMYHLKGWLHQAAATFEEAVQNAQGEEVLQALVGRPAYFVGMADLLREWNDLDAAERHLGRWMELMQGTLAVDADIVTLGYTVLARLQFSRGAHREASATLEALTQLTHRRHFAPHLIAQAAAVHAQIELTQGNLAAALRWSESSRLRISDEQPGYLQERAYLTLARVRITQSRADLMGSQLDDTLGLLTRLLKDAEDKARMNSALEILIVRALALEAGGKRREALLTLKRAVHLAEPQGYIRLFIDEGPPMVTLLRQALTQGISPDYITTILMATGIDTQPVPPPASALLEPLTERELEVLRLLVAGLSNQAIAQSLTVTVGTVKRHVNSIYGKLGVGSRTQAVARAHSLGLL